MNIKIADFGMAAMMKNGSLLETSCGSPHYASPEVITGSKYDGLEADIWSCGVILFALLVGRLPFDNPNVRSLLNKVKTGIFTMPKNLPKSAKDILWRMLAVDPKKRITIAEIKKHPFFLSDGFIPNPSPQNLHSESNISFKSEEELDVEILNTLLSFWDEKKELIEELLSEEPNLPKKFYEVLIIRRKNLNGSFNPILGKSINHNNNINGNNNTSSHKIESKSPPSNDIINNKVDKKNLHNSTPQPPIHQENINNNTSSTSNGSKESNNISNGLKKLKEKRQKKHDTLKGETLHYNPNIMENNTPIQNPNNPPQNFMYEKYRFMANDEKFKSRSVDEENIEANKLLKARANSTTSVEGKSFWSRRSKKETKKEKEEAPRKTSWLSSMLKKATSKKKSSAMESDSKDESSNNNPEPSSNNSDDFYSVCCEFYSKEQLATLLEEILMKLKVNYKLLSKGKFIKATYTVGENSVKFTCNISNGVHQITDTNKLPLLLEFFKQSGNQGLYQFICKQIENMIKS
eukprot:TRINITY_DN4205_c0_g1_i2.p1 TRINITY_DN4205_c0_g1~~TRINITY_DN4205_c0_g1_i2.p1  ORF type:complete len:520 (-),score=176.50 TRINITY_DN4205_c0_g1_i2:100-1659(-)